MLVHFPIALLLTGVVMEFLSRKRPTLTIPAAGLLVTGVVFGWLSAAAGLLSFYTVPAHTKQAHVLMWWHLGFAVLTLLLFTWIAVKRWKARQVSARHLLLLASLCGAALLVVTGYLGGMIVYHGGAGIQPDLLSPEIRTGHHHGDSGQEATSGKQSGNDHERARGEGQHEH
ncbi:DUF2231 domain-containing protein [Gimesia sp.]|uniref:DUF2231 domain-containing protein n=1 Tax=Gimesia sp. TaxID=2024833 RepID=UPI0025BE5608|nr:DUF2231 domain-containing protein [Gimesia sp.]